MSRTTIVSIIYIIGLIFGALFLKIWSADTNVYKGLLGLGWTAIFLISLFFADKHEKKLNILSFFYYSFYLSKI